MYKSWNVIKWPKYVLCIRKWFQIRYFYKREMLLEWKVRTSKLCSFVKATRTMAEQVKINFFRYLENNTRLTTIQRILIQEKYLNFDKNIKLFIKIFLNSIFLFLALQLPSWKTTSHSYWRRPRGFESTPKLILMELLLFDISGSSLKSPILRPCLYLTNLGLSLWDKPFPHGIWHKRWVAST